MSKSSHIVLWSVAEDDNDERPNGVGLSYKDDECDGFQVQLNEGILENEHPVGEECVCVNASVVDTLRTQRVEEELENEASDSEDETRWQYISDDEGPAIPHDDEDDDSDLD